MLDHVLFAGPPGLGKTSLAHIIARELGVNVHVTSGPAIERAADLAAIVNNLEEHDVLFIDEIHRLQRVVEERLYSAMEDFEFHIVVGEGMGARTMKLAVNPFTLVGATTRSGLLSSPLRDRFGQHFHLDFYNHDELSEIVRRSAALAECRHRRDRSAWSSRRARAALRESRIACCAACATSRRSTRRRSSRAQIALGALELLEIDAAGFDKMDRAILGAIIDKFDGGPVGVESLAAAVGEESRHDRGSLRALPVAGGIPGAHLARPRRHPARVYASRPHPPRHFALAISPFASETHSMAKIYVLQHHPVENLGNIADALEGAALAWQYVQRRPRASRCRRA